MREFNSKVRAIIAPVLEVVREVCRATGEPSQLNDRYYEAGRAKAYTIAYEIIPLGKSLFIEVRFSEDYICDVSASIVGGRRHNEGITLPTCTLDQLKETIDRVIKLANI